MEGKGLLRSQVDPALKALRPGVRRRSLTCGVLVSDEAGRFVLEPHGLADQENLSPFGYADRLGALAGRYLQARRRSVSSELDYLILVPTLRCNLACSYCQVSRAALGARQHDWSDETLGHVLDLVSGLRARAVKIEFQGGEPTLRPDLIAKVIAAVPPGVDALFVICTNLQTIDDTILAIFDRDDVLISTSLDGPLELHARQRSDTEQTRRFAENFRFLLDRYGPNKISALPTVDPSHPPRPADLVDAFAAFGMRSIYLRPINFQGFARKNHSAAREIGEAWSDYHRSFIRYLVERNWQDRGRVFEETYFSLILRRIFRPGSNRHVDLRNPNPMGQDYIVIDHDGTAYPTDEARMLTRAGIIDLSIGDVASGWQTEKRAALNAASTNDGDPACETCAYKPFCGRDIVDDISRYGTTSLPRHETEFCRRHLALFDFAFEMIHSDSDKTRYSLGHWLNLPGPFPRVVAVS
ncbi:MAG: His-Xaa-Ser system radical SAM maturase HxsB [Erythrobacter sp.]|nr:His-Xaa-Ser system radical SAM maturase HxsB [Erythrobacter sp.]MBA4163018.1 His-Xaa-Ser system radical SAM maturase HxsB [Erythrobacter sp.]